MKKFILFIFLCLGISSPLFAAVDPAQLSEQTLKRFEFVPEFKFIIQEANKLGVKVYLFGGTASAFAHYVRWDLEREAGDDKYQAERFDYDFTNIYRGNQDLDIVVDGTPKQADALKTILQKEYPHFVGNREAWEVRLLRESRDDKRALLGDEDFKKQHSDTNSTGMLLINPDEGDVIYNDLLDWGSSDSDFLNDVASARIKFLVGSDHKQTERFKTGLNPPVLAAIRYLAKLAQYEVEGTDADLEIVTQMIEETDVTNLSKYGKRKAEEFALKTILNAPDSEYAWNLLESTGARSKLIEMDGDRLQTKESLSWWMNKEPLRSYDLGTRGKTASEIFGVDEIIVSHETNSFKAYDNITRSSKGGANAFISRKGINGETAAHGDGFYTKYGLEGARQTGLTIRFKLHPKAREGEDFFKVDDFIIVKNKKALTLIQENLNIGILDFINLFVQGELARKDKGLIEKFKRKFGRKKISKEEFQEEISSIEEKLFIGQDLPAESRFNYQEYDNFMDLFNGYNSFLRTNLLPLIQTPDFWKDKSEVIEELLNRGIFVKEIIKFILADNHSDVSDKIIDKLVKKGTVDEYIILNLLSQPKWGKNKDWIEYYFQMNSVEIDALLMQSVLTQEFSKGYYDDLLTRIYNRGHHDILIKGVSYETYAHSTFTRIPKHADFVFFRLALGANILSREHWKDHPVLKEYIEDRIEKEKREESYVLQAWELLQTAKYRDSQFVGSPVVGIMREEHWMGDPYQIEIINRFLSFRVGSKKEMVVIDILSHSSWVQHPGGLELILKYYNTSPHKVRFDMREAVLHYVFSQKHWVGEQRVISFLENEIKKGNTRLLKYMIKRIFVHDYWLKNSEGLRLFKLLLKKIGSLLSYTRDAFQKKDLRYPERTRSIFEQLEISVLKNQNFITSPVALEVVKDIILNARNPKIRLGLINSLGSEEWMQHPLWVEIVKLFILHSTKREEFDIFQTLIFSSTPFLSHPSVKGVYTLQVDLTKYKEHLKIELGPSGEKALKSPLKTCESILWAL